MSQNGIGWMMGTGMLVALAGAVSCGDDEPNANPGSGAAGAAGGNHAGGASDGGAGGEGGDAAGGAGAGGASAVVEGTFLGQPVEVEDAVHLDVGGGGADVRVVLLTGAPDTCDLIEQMLIAPLEDALGFVVIVSNEAGDAQIEPGTYEVGEGFDPVTQKYTSLEVFLERTNSDCGDTVPPGLGDATGGELVITEVGEAKMSGTFSIDFVTGDVLTGSFDAPLCAAEASENPGCQQ